MKKQNLGWIISVIFKINNEASPILSQEGNATYIDWIGIQKICGGR